MSKSTRPMAVLAGLLLGSSLLAPQVQAAEADPQPAASSTQTDIVGSKEAPSVFNIVPWKEKELSLPKRAVNTSILRETLQPLDRDVLRREVQLQQSLARE